jgi:16S rRNA (uracil1498-N3)-methyltransferase
LSNPYFFHPEIGSSEFILDEESSRHIVSVLRMKKGEKINLTDGKGIVATCEITDDHKKHCKVHPASKIQHPASTRSVTIAISLIKNSSRFEWFLEKATEIGVSAIIPLLCHRTEKQKFREERMKSIIVSAMLQSQQAWLPVLYAPLKFKDVISSSMQDQKFIAHCNEDEKRNLADLLNENLGSQIILIGPEGDFTSDEIELARQHHFTGVTLGDTRLRTETAGLVAATLMKVG